MIEMERGGLGILKDLREVFKGLKRGRLASKLCPVCGSSKLRLSSSFDIWLTPVQYICENCGYKGSIVMEIEEGEKKLQRLSRSRSATSDWEESSE